MFVQSRKLLHLYRSAFVRRTGRRVVNEDSRDSSRRGCRYGRQE